MKFGLALPYVGARDVARLAQLAEESGWDGCFLGDAIWCQDPMIGLAAAAMVTQRIRLGTMIIPAPLRRPWKLASESLALDHLSDGRLILGLGAGAVWMGWQSFPTEVTETKARAEMLDETIDMLTLMYQGEPVDYHGKHYQLKLTLMDEMHYPPKPIQQPRIPLWVPVLWPMPKSMQRALRCDGLIAEKRGPEGQPQAVTPADLREMVAFVQATRTLTTPFDFVVSGKTADMDLTQSKEHVRMWQEAGTTWWVEAMWEASIGATVARIRQGPPGLG